MRISDFRRNDAAVNGCIWDFQTGQRVEAPNDHLCVRIAERDNPRHRAALSRLQLEHADDLRAGGDRASAAWRKVQTRAMAEALVLEWWNLDDDAGAPILYTTDRCESLLGEEANFPFRHFCEDASSTVRGYRAAMEEQAKGN